MCFDQQRLFRLVEEINTSRGLPSADDNRMIEILRGDLAETEARLARARAREAELSRRLESMKRFLSVMQILEAYLRTRLREQQQALIQISSPEKL
ncbi:protein SKIP34 [Papaver somniferum]|uniref:protein SKIP34 n=1 Tax=Papaver somniferum TaxID=3469 RepID=UPI000E700A45|nr:protein SKIP34 [Papaver somniferum]